jgi:hypothetical protein
MTPDTGAIAFDMHPLRPDSQCDILLIYPIATAVNHTLDQRITAFDFAHTALARHFDAAPKGMIVEVVDYIV